MAKLSPDGTPVFITYLGAAGSEQSGGIAVDSDGSAVVTGSSQTGPTTSAFVTKLSPDGTAVLFSQLLAGEYFAQGRSVAIGPSNEIVIAGVSATGNVPKGFIARLDSAGVVRSRSLLPGSGRDVALDRAGKSLYFRYRQ